MKLETFKKKNEIRSFNFKQTLKLHFFLKLSFKQDIFFIHFLCSYKGEARWRYLNSTEYL
jgi:hypothetical protein